jgi:sulfite exporter TauE/SafE
MYLLAALSLGFLGSFHCIGMCGPIALTIPVNRSSSINIFKGSLIYNLGRIITYSTLGLVFGSIGQGFAFAGLQSALSITLGVFILLFLVLPKLTPKIGFIYRELEKVKSEIRKLFGKHTVGSLLLIGILNGLLPCGLVYLGIVGSIATGDMLKGAFFMAAFGAGTIPAMLAITVARDYISVKFRERIRRTIPVFVGIMAVMLILRGLNLGIPYISPSVAVDNGIAVIKVCH